MSVCTRKPRGRSAVAWLAAVLPAAVVVALAVGAATAFDLVPAPVSEAVAGETPSKVQTTEFVPSTEVVELGGHTPV